MDEKIIVGQSLGLKGTVYLMGAKNAVLCIMASLILTRGKSTLYYVPHSHDVIQMIELLRSLGAAVEFSRYQHRLDVDTTHLNNFRVCPEIMKKMRASFLVMGPLLARFGKADIAMSGGCVIGKRPIDFHLKNFVKMGVEIQEADDNICARVTQLNGKKLILDYPSVGATENLLMAAVLASGETKIMNASLEPEVMDLIRVLSKMGAQIEIQPPATLVIQGVSELNPIEHTIMPDRLEAGSLLLAAAVTGGTVELPNARANDLDIFLMKLQEMGHSVEVGPYECGITLRATLTPQAISFKTAPYPGFPTDLQAPMMVAQCLASGTSVIQETVFENRLCHVQELQKMGAQITVEHDKAFVTGVKTLQGTLVQASDIRASVALVLAGLAAQGTTTMTGVHHWRRGYDAMEVKLRSLGAQVQVEEKKMDIHPGVPAKPLENEA